MINFLKQHKKFGTIVLVILVFGANLAGHYFVYRSQNYIQKQYPNLLLARNWAKTGRVAYESKENIVLEVSALQKQGVETDLGNKLTFYLYGLYFRAFGFQPDTPVFISFILYSLAAVFIFLLAWRLAGINIALVTAGLNLVASFYLRLANSVGSQEWAFFFLVLATFLYFWPKKRNITFLILTGLFLGLATAAKNSFFVAIFGFLSIEFWLARADIRLAIKKSLVLLVAFLAATAPFIFIGGNFYLSELFYFSAPKTDYEPSYLIEHVFPDPYTYRFERDIFLKDFNANSGQALGWESSVTLLKKYGAHISFWQSEIISRIFTAWIYFKGLVLSVVVFGGLLSWLLILMGLRELQKRKEKIFLFFFLFSFAAWFLVLVFLRSANYSQLLIITFPILLASAIGLWRLAELIAQYLNFKKISVRKTAAAIGVIFLLFFSQISWWSLKELYSDLPMMDKILSFAHQPKNAALFDESGVTAVGWSKETPELLNYYLDRNFIYFDPVTIKKLADKNELEQVFKNYGITSYTGYDKDLSEIIAKNTGNKLKSIRIGE